MSQFLICSNCDGTGFFDKKICLNCKGIGFGLWHEGRFIYWGRALNEESILERKIKRFAGITANFLLGLFGLFGIIILVFTFWKTGIDLEELFTRDFSLPKQILLIFWFSLFFDLYLYSRIKRKDVGSVIIEKPCLSTSNIPLLSLTEVDRLKKKFKIDISQNFSQRSQQAIEEAYILAKRFAHLKVLPIHLFFSLLKIPEIKVILARLEISPQILKERVKNILEKEKKFPGVVPKITPDLIKIFLNSYLKAWEGNLKRVYAEDLLAIIAREEKIKEILFEFEIDQDKLKNIIAWTRINRMLFERRKEFLGLARFRPKGIMNRAMTAVSTPFLDQFSEDLTFLAKLGYLPLCLNREKELEEIFRILEGARVGVILVGEPGVGKNAIIEGLAQLMVEERVPKILRDKRLLSLSIARLTAGTTSSGARERFLRICCEIARAKNIVLYIPEIHGSVGIKEGGIDLADLLTEEIKRGYFPCLSATTPQLYTRFIESSSLGSVLQKVIVNEPETNEAIQILEAKIGNIEYRNKVFFSYEAIKRTVELSKTFLHEFYLPEKAIEIAEEVAHHVLEKRGTKAMAKGEDVSEIISQKTKIPLTTIVEEEREKLLRLEEVIHERIIDQEEAVKEVSLALRRAKVGLKSGKKPIASFLFLGPTGVGKTEMAKTVAEVFFAGGKQMIRLDMSEYQDKASVYRLLGTPSEGGLLTEAVRRNPYSLLLLDEVEKAHPDVLNIFLAILDDGRATDGAGRVIDFTNEIIIGTSNAGSSYIQEELRKGSTMEQIKEGLLQKEIGFYFRPEFLNRFDGIIVFKPLSLAEIEEITRLLINREIKRAEEKYGIILEVTEGTIKELAQAGFDPVFGARPLKRVIRKRIEDVLAYLLLEKRIKRRDIVIFDKSGEVRIKKATEL